VELSEVVRSTGSCRFFTGDAVPDDVLARALDHARFAPQGGNRQPVRFVVVRDPAHRKQLAEWYLVPWKAYLKGTETGDIAIGGQPRLLRDADHFAEHLHEVPVMVVVCADPDGIHPTDHELGRLSVVGGGSIYPAVQNFLLGCRDVGLGAAFTTLLCMFEPQVKELLSIPDGIITAGHIAVGWPARPFPTRLSRRPLAEVAFAESYGTPLPGA
jgi:nitroreductase